jgi:tRNA (cmo5U34)-methyltransferase
MSGAEPGAPEAWAEDDSAAFIEFGPAFVPARERQQAILAELVAAVRPSRVVELCCGGGELARLVLQWLPGCRLLALDGSARMLAEAAATCADHRDRLELRRFELAEPGWRRLEPAPDAVYSSLAVHHLDGAGKRQLFADLFSALAPGGVFVLADLIRPESAIGRKLAGDDWQAAVAERSQALHGDDRALRAFERLRWNHFRLEEPDALDQPSGLVEQLGWLAQAGFVEVDVHWLVAGHAILSARKPERTP